MGLHVCRAEGTAIRWSVYAQASDDMNRPKDFPLPSETRWQGRDFRLNLEAHNIRCFTTALIFASSSRF